MNNKILFEVNCPPIRLVFIQVESTRVSLDEEEDIYIKLGHRGLVRKITQEDCTQLIFVIFFL